ncbi:heat shock factor protein 3-like isoform X2 [Hemicordylus capensis]|uniref:heat shock factor protein 3-like isoform X2 n=1 Tax=Hemicordylus capensis TaxID=884348 RepID=UPI0023030EEB|nr:heat shock factor protein 3-like isoform X2 [Hemicordylus capensis]
MLREGRGHDANRQPMVGRGQVRPRPSRNVALAWRRRLRSCGTEGSIEAGPDSVVEVVVRMMMMTMKKEEEEEETAAGLGTSPVPGFLAKLWALVEDSGSDEVICWSQNGQNFCILNEQRFAKELLPKYFKHNNLSSFIRQLNIYGFRKVIALENGMTAADKNSAIEFQHPFFKRGKANLLANIKRKVSAVRAEDLKVCPEDLHKVLSEVQEMREQQTSMDLKLASMKRENKALWKEVASLRQKHSQQQQLLSKILEFILGLMRGNCILGLKRKRPLADPSGAPPSKYSRQYVRIPVEDCEAAAISQHSPDGKDSLIICDITDAHEEEVEDGPEKLLALAHPSNRNWETQLPTKEGLAAYKAPPASELEFPETRYSVELIDNPGQASAVGSNAVELHSVQAGACEDPDAVIDSILNGNETVAQSDSLLDREVMQDFLNCIDASLEELQAMLSGKKFSYASEAPTDTISPELPVMDTNLAEVAPGLDHKICRKA